MGDLCGIAQQLHHPVRLISAQSDSSDNFYPLHKTVKYTQTVISGHAMVLAERQRCAWSLSFPRVITRIYVNAIT